MIQQIKRLYRWYKEAEASPVEQETVTYMVVPFLLALGWSEQQIAIQWNKIDVSCFCTPPSGDVGLRERENCCLVVEVKRIGSGLAWAEEQARNYVKQHKLTCCRHVLVTDGLRYRLIDLNADESDNLSAGMYINLEKIRNLVAVKRLLPSALTALK